MDENVVVILLIVEGAVVIRVIVVPFKPNTQSAHFQFMSQFVLQLRRYQ